jgi:hypothetical protein
MMGFFDTIKYQGDEYQTKDTPRQFCENYKIEVDQDSGLPYLWLEEYDSEWVAEPDPFYKFWLGGHMKTSNHHWVRCDDFDGTIYFYRVDEYKDWTEYKALFMNGRMIKIVKIENDERKDY